MSVSHAELCSAWWLARDVCLEITALPIMQAASHSNEPPPRRPRAGAPAVPPTTPTPSPSPASLLRPLPPAPLLPWPHPHHPSRKVLPRIHLPHRLLPQPPPWGPHRPRRRNHLHTVLSPALTPDHAITPHGPAPSPAPPRNHANLHPPHLHLAHLPLHHSRVYICNMASRTQPLPLHAPACAVRPHPRARIRAPPLPAIP